MDLVRMLRARGRELERLMTGAAERRDQRLVAAGRPGTITYSKKVFIPVTTLCRDRCHYCTFVDTPTQAKRRGAPLYMSPEQVLAVATQGARLGCKEALFTLGDRPEGRWPEAREWLRARGFESTLGYVAHLAERVLNETGLLPHLNPGVMSLAELRRLRPVSPSMGMMLETTSHELWDTPGRAHYGSPDKDPRLRLQVIDEAGEARVPFTTGLLIGIGETVRDRAESILALRDAAERHGHIQEVIVQNFRAKPGTAMREEPDADWEEYLAAVAATRLALGLEVCVQAPPNLSDPGRLEDLLRAGVDDWGGVSPLTPDHVNPERPWPAIQALEDRTRAGGFALTERLTAHPRYVRDPARWFDPAVSGFVERLADPDTGLAAQRTGAVAERTRSVHGEGIRVPLHHAETAPESLSDADLVSLLKTEGGDLSRLLRLADDVRRYTVGEVVTFVANRSISSSGFIGAGTGTRGRRSTLFDTADARGIAAECRRLGLTELCVQGRPWADAGSTPYLELIAAMKSEAPELHLHAFRAGELIEGAERAGESLARFLRRLRGAGLGSVTGTGITIPGSYARGVRPARPLPLDDWSRTIGAVHAEGLRSTAVLVYGAGENAAQRVSYMRRLARIQGEHGGFTEIIPMPASEQVSALVPGRTQLDEHRAMTAVCRLFFQGSIRHIQVAWPRLDDETVIELLRVGGDDLGGTLTDGVFRPDVNARRGVQRSEKDLRALARKAGRPSRPRTTLHGRIEVPA